MKSKSLLSSLGLAVFLALTLALGARTQGRKTAAYTVTDLGTFGGSYSFPYAINSSGMVSGGAATPSQTNGVAQTGFLWDGGRLIKLGTLGGSACPNCNSEGASPIVNGSVAVDSETEQPAAEGEDFCAFGTHLQCLAALWKSGGLTALPTLPGGNNSQAFFTNNEGEIVGLSETGVKDVTCMDATPSQVYQFEAVKWEPNGQVVPLPPLPNDTVSFGFGINDNGQAVGDSGLCSNTSAPPASSASLEAHGVFWDADGTPHALATPPGSAGILTVATSVNNQGNVGGGSMMTDGTIHAFVWSSYLAEPQDIGTYPAGSPQTVVPCCGAINDSGRIVGYSVDAGGNIRALLWQDGKPVDLNTLIPANSPWYLLLALSINDADEIVAIAFNSNTFEVHAVLLSPVAGIGPAARGATKPPALPANVKAVIFSKGRR